MRFFCSGFLHWSNIYRPNNKAFECFRFCTWIHRLIQIFNIWWWLSCCRVSFPVDWVNAKWDSISTESKQSETPRQLSQCGMMKSRKCWCPLHRLGRRGVSLRVDSVDMESHSALTQLMGSLTPRWLSVRKMNQTKTGIHTQLWLL
jgi:hypothetical protein